MLGSMNKKAKIIRVINSKDTEGFSIKTEEVIAEIRCYKEGRHGSERWANLASFSEATDLFRFRKIPGVKVTEEFFIIFEEEKYDTVQIGDTVYTDVVIRTKRLVIPRPDWIPPAGTVHVVLTQKLASSGEIYTNEYDYTYSPE